MDEKSNNKKAQMPHAYKLLFFRNGFDLRFTLRSRRQTKRAPFNYGALSVFCKFDCLRMRSRHRKDYPRSNRNLGTGTAAAALRHH